MNTEEYIAQEIRSYRIGEHPLSVKFADDQIAAVLDSYRKNSFHDLMALIEATRKKVRRQTTLINFLGNGGGTYTEFAEISNQCYDVARRQINGSQLAIRVKMKIQKPHYFKLNPEYEKSA